MIKDGYWDYTEDGATAQPYGQVRSYERAFELLRNCRSVEDWGSGYGWFKQTYGGRLRIVSVDSARGAPVDIPIDLRKHFPSAPAVLLRHVLEHDPDNWTTILHRAATARTLVVILFLDPRELVCVPDQITTVSVDERRLLDILWSHDFSVRREVIQSVEPFTAGKEEFRTEWLYHMTR